MQANQYHKWSPHRLKQVASIGRISLKYTCNIQNPITVINLELVREGIKHLGYVGYVNSCIPIKALVQFNY